MFDSDNRNGKQFLVILFILLSLKSVAQSAVNTAIKNEIKIVAFFSTTCPICQYYTKNFNELSEQYPDFDIQLLLVGKYAKKDIQKFKSDYNIKQKIIVDSKYKLSKKYHATITPEVFLLKNGEIIYSGLIDDSFYEIGRRRQTGVTNYLFDAIQHCLQNQPIQPNRTEPIGCLINK